MAGALKSDHPAFRERAYTKIAVYEGPDGLYTPYTINPKDYTKAIPSNVKTPNEEIAEILRKHPDLAIENYKNGSNNPKRTDVSPGDRQVGDLLVFTKDDKVLAVFNGVFNGESPEKSITLSKAFINEPNSKVHNCENLTFKFGYQGEGPGRGQTTNENEIAGVQLGFLNDHIAKYKESEKHAQYAKAEIPKTMPSGNERYESLGTLPSQTFPPAQITPIAYER
jgi:hypothetical protein